MEVQNLKQFLAWKPPQVDAIISHGILLPETRLVIYGLWKSWKSMLAQHTAFCLTTGSPWFGFSTTPTSVMLVQLEIPKALLQQRVRKYANGHKMYPDNFHFATQHYLKLDRDFGLDALTKAVDAINPGVVMIDPVYKVLSGNISDSYDMMKLLDNLDRLMDRYHFTLILITHTRKPKTDEAGDVIDRGVEDMMGSSYLPNWLDTAIGVKITGHDLVEISFTTMRHAEEELHPFSARIDRATLGFHRLGLTTPVIPSP